jgi:acyl-CoA synthetase (AMP-forming)/AMP-acid ligase II
MQHLNETTIDSSYNCRCTNITATPSLYIDLIANAKRLSVNLTTLKVAAVGGAPCKQETIHDMMDILNIRRVSVSQGDLFAWSDN